VVDLRLHGAIDEIPKHEWDSLLGDGPPFLCWDFLQALEQTGCVDPEKGWAPAHLSLSEGSQMIAVAPAYIKGNSEGEFVFDHSWAEFAYARLRHRYYPKLIVAAPFTPATGPRLLMRPDVDSEQALRALAGGLGRIIEENDLSSAHVLFAEVRQAEALERAGLLLRQGVQYHWHNPGYANFEDFLSRYSSKRRNQIRRERRELEVQGVELDVKLGSDLSNAEIDHVFEFYAATVDKYFWGRRYLNRNFFQEICSRIGSQILVVLARDKSNPVPLAGAFNLLGPHKLYGRYWGAREERKFLHFNVCYYRGIEECIARGLKGFEPGAGGEHKLARGFEPVITYSAHKLKHPTLHAAIREFLTRERKAVREEISGATPLLKPLGDVSNDDS
jgi:hypothetical protein